jgi:myo-inositol 2-dehydrogenase / D-chiro-inositol 1-dehydrogenase
MASRRDFLKNSAKLTGGLLASATTLPIAASPSALPTSAPIIKIGLIGCGDRGTGAAMDAMAADPGVRLSAMGDVFADNLQTSLTELQNSSAAAQLMVSAETSFVGLDAYQKVIDEVDVVLLTTPPAFRPQHLKAAIAAGKHVFCEKPVAVDAAGVRSVFETVAEAKRQNLAIVSGFCWRYEDAIREYMRRIHRGAIGRITAIHSVYYSNTLTSKFPGSRAPEWSDLEWQLRNWNYFNWLSGDHLVEQAVHSVDKIAWLMQDEVPVQAIATGGRQVPMTYGDTYDHFHVSYEFANGVRGLLSCRQQDNCYNETSDYAMGTKGIWSNGRGVVAELIRGRKVWKYPDEPRDMYEFEHQQLFASIRAGKPINDGVRMTNSTLMAIMGRMSAYTGKVITWEEALNSNQSLGPKHLDWNMSLPTSSYPVPGQTTLA